MSFDHCDVPYLATLQYPRKLYRYSLGLNDATLYSAAYSSTCQLLPHCADCLLVIHRKSVERFDLKRGRPADSLPDAPLVLSNAVVECTTEGILALWANSRAYQLSFATREWTPLKSDIDKLPNIHCLLDHKRLLMLYAHTIWLTNRTTYFSEGTMEGRVFYIEKGESVAFAVKLDLVGHFGCVPVGSDQVLLFGGYEELRFNGSCLLDGNDDVYLLDINNFQVKKVSKLCTRLEEPNLGQRAVVWGGFAHCISGRELLRIDLRSYESEVVRLISLQTRSVLQLLWIFEKLRARQQAISQIPACLVRETALYLTAIARTM